MRIALVVPGGVDRSGEYRVIPALLALIQRLALDNDVQVFALSQETGTGEWDLLGARIHNIGVGHTRLRAIRAISRLHRSARFDVVHAIWSGACGLIAVAAGKALGIPSLVHIAGGELVSMPDIGFGGMQTRRGRVREWLVLRGASCITAASAPVLGALSELGLSAHRVPLGVDLKIWPPRPPVRRQDGRPARLIHVASLNRVKDQATLLRALASLAESRLDFEMDIVGEDTLHGEIQAMAEKMGLSRAIRFRGFLPQRQLRPLVEQADLLIHSSRHEAGPLVMLEAAVAGVPTVGTAVGHIAEWAPSAAVSVPVGDWAGLAGAIAHLLSDDLRRVEIASEALRRAVREDADYTAERFHALYAGLICMNQVPQSHPAPRPQTLSQLQETRSAFDSVAADYDGPRGNNDLIQDMRSEMWRWLDATYAPGSRLVDLGCGTGLDAVRMARVGHQVTATDWSPQMVARTTDRAEREGLANRVQAIAVGAHELHRLDSAGAYDGAYSNLGPLNCVPDLGEVSKECARLLRPGGKLVFTVIGRVCPWEIAHYLRRGRLARATVRFARKVVPVGMNSHIIWTRYYTPREFYRAFEREFALEHYRGLGVFAPPPYLTWMRDKYPRCHEWLWRIDRRTAGWPMLRSIGDHFLISMRKR